MLQTFYVDENHHFLTYSAKDPAKIPCFYDFLVKNWFLLIFAYIFNTSKFPRACWLYDVTVTSYEVQWYSFWYQWIEEVHTHTLVANIGVLGILYRKLREGLQQPPFWRMCYKKYLRRMRVNRVIFWNLIFCTEFLTNTYLTLAMCCSTISQQDGIHQECTMKYFNDVFNMFKGK